MNNSENILMAIYLSLYIYLSIYFNIFWPRGGGGKGGQGHNFALPREHLCKNMCMIIALPRISIQDLYHKTMDLVCTQIKCELIKLQMLKPWLETAACCLKVIISAVARGGPTGLRSIRKVILGRQLVILKL